MKWRRAATTAGARRAPRVVFLSICFDPEPGTVMGLPLAQRLRELGDYDVRVLTAVPWYPLGRVYPGYKMKLWQWEELGGVRVLRVPVYPSHDRSPVRRVATYLSFMLAALFIGIPLIGRADIVYYFDSLPTTGVVAAILAALRRAAVVQHIGDLWPDTVTESGMLPRGRFVRIAEKSVGAWISWLYRRHAAITVASPGLKHLLVDRKVIAEKISVVQTWAFEDKFYPMPADPSLRASLGFDRFTVLYAGNVGPLQALDTVLRAAHELRDRGDIQIAIMGGGQSEGDLRRLHAELGLTNVRLLPPRPMHEMNAINASADALLVHLRDIPIMHATTPSKTQVAMACGKPVLMGVRGDAAQLIVDANAGFAFPPESPQEMADAIRALADLSEGERTAMGRNGRDYYERHLSRAVGGRVVHDIFQRILTDHRGAADAGIATSAPEVARQ
jgi:glycosyltransferase involved in cell wall biosynthesis